MPKFDFSKAACFVYVSREGALSNVGHDLKLQATNFTLKGKVVKRPSRSRSRVVPIPSGSLAPSKTEE